MGSTEEWRGAAAQQRRRGKAEAPARPRGKAEEGGERRRMPASCVSVSGGTPASCEWRGKKLRTDKWKEIQAYRKWRNVSDTKNLSRDCRTATGCRSVDFLFVNICS